MRLRSGKIRQIQQAFTLAELLIALAILGVIATFTIPKILQAQQNQAWKSEAKEAAGTISSAFAAFKLNNTLAAGNGGVNLTPYINYVKLQTSGQIDDYQGNGLQNCAASAPCLVLHNGGTLRVDSWDAFRGTASTNATYFYFDPDANGSTNGPAKSIFFFLYTTGKLTTFSGCDVNTTSNGNATGYWNWACPGLNPDPAWFSWN